MRPLRTKWEETKVRARPYLDWISQQEEDQDFLRQRLHGILSQFQERLANVKVLDPACGSGNFLYVSLALLKALEKEVVAFATAHGLGDFVPRVHPAQLFGIETNEYAHELASAVVWIGYLQWKYRNAFDLAGETPILQPLDNIQLKDAVVEVDDRGRYGEPDWPRADVIIGNPPFLGGKILRRELGDEYVDTMFGVWDDRVPARGGPVLLLVREGALGDRAWQSAEGRATGNPGGQRRQQSRGSGSGRAERRDLLGAV